MKSYNGFSPSDRMKAFRWLKEQYASGAVSRPNECQACGQTEGHIEAHSEDYGAPYGPHIGEYHLCYRCHMMLHCRFSSPEAWEQYKLQLREGAIFKPLAGRNFPAVRAYLQGHRNPLSMGENRGKTCLEAIGWLDRDTGAEQELRACISCDVVYVGPLECPRCGEPGEPMAQPDTAPHAHL